jgi:long-chain acyl-CoA synthetase
MNVYPEDLEAALRAQPEVRDCVVVGISRDGNEEPCAVLILRSDTESPEAVVRRANESLAGFQQIRDWQLWPSEDFPRTPTQKPRINVIREAVEAALQAKGSGVPVSGPPAGPLEELLGQITGRTAALTPDANLEADLNLSSLDRVELLSALEDRFQTDVDEASFSLAKTVGELDQLLRRERPVPVPYPFPRWAQRWPVNLLRAAVYYLLTWPATALMAFPRVRGRGRLKEVAGSLLFVCNHVTEIDAGFVLAALPFRYRHRLAVAMVGERLRDLRYPPAAAGILRRIVDPVKYILVSALFNVFPMPKQSGVRRSFQYAGESVDRGYSVLIFPEGQLTREGSVGPFRAGIGVLATKLNLPVVPMRIDGLYELREAGRRFARPGTVQVTIGPPVRFSGEAEPERIVRELHALVAGLGGENFSR